MFRGLIVLVLFFCGAIPCAAQELQSVDLASRLLNPTTAGLGSQATASQSKQSKRTVIQVGELGKGIAVADNAVGSGYIMYSKEVVHERFGAVHKDNAHHFVAVRFVDDRWQYNTNEAWEKFAPVASDILVASVDFSLDKIELLSGTDESSHVESSHGVVTGYISGDLSFVSNRWAKRKNLGEFGVDGTVFTVGGDGGPQFSQTTLNYYWTGAGGDELWSNANNWLDDNDQPAVPVSGFTTDLHFLGGGRDSYIDIQDMKFQNLYIDTSGRRLVFIWDLRGPGFEGPTIRNGKVYVSGDGSTAFFNSELKVGANAGIDVVQSKISFAGNAPQYDDVGNVISEGAPTELGPEIIGVDEVTFSGTQGTINFEGLMDIESLEPGAIFEGDYYVSNDLDLVLSGDINVTYQFFNTYVPLPIDYSLIVDGTLGLGYWETLRIGLSEKSSITSNGVATSISFSEFYSSGTCTFNDIESDYGMWWIGDAARFEVLGEAKFNELLRCDPIAGSPSATEHVFHGPVEFEFGLIAQQSQVGLDGRGHFEFLDDITVGPQCDFQIGGDFRCAGTATFNEPVSFVRYGATYIFDGPAIFAQVDSLLNHNISTGTVVFNDVVEFQGNLRMRLLPPSPSDPNPEPAKVTFNGPASISSVPDSFYDLEVSDGELVVNDCLTIFGHMRTDDLSNGAITGGPAGEIVVKSTAIFDLGDPVAIEIPVFVDPGGIVTREGDYRDNAIIDGILDPGDQSFGTVTFDDLDLAGTSTTCIEVGPGTSGETVSDQVTGNTATSKAALDGRLVVQTSEGFVPDAGDEIFIFQDIDITGEFADIVFVNASCELEYGPNFVRLHSFVPFSPASAFNLEVGSLENGDSADMAASDNAALQFKQASLAPPFTADGVRVVFDGTLNDANPGSLSIRIEASANTDGLLQTIECWNWSSSSWEQVHITSSIEKLGVDDPDAAIVVELTDDVSSFVDANGHVSSRVTYRKNPNAYLAQTPWVISIDQVAWLPE